MLYDILPVSIVKMYFSDEDPREDWVMRFVTESWIDDQTDLSIRSGNNYPKV